MNDFRTTPDDGTPRLHVELVPRTCFFSNLRSNLPGKVWQQLRKDCFDLAGHRCEICGEDDSRRSLECHEIWAYDDDAHVQSLVGLVALCRNCHRVKHMALARHMGWEYQAEQHFMRVNGWNRIRTMAYLEEVFELFEQRSAHPWQLDVTWLACRGVCVPDVLDRDGCA